jgi:hypothetical protein
VRAGKKIEDLDLLGATELMAGAPEFDTN